MTRRFPFFDLAGESGLFKMRSYIVLGVPVSCV